MKTKNKKFAKVNKNVTWETNHMLIENAYWEYLNKNNKIPSFQKIADMTGLSRITVDKHLRGATLDMLKPYFKPMTTRVIKKLGLTAEETGRAAETKLYLQVIEGFTETSKTEHKIDTDKLKKEIENIFE